MNYSDISPRTQAHVDRRLLTRAKNNNIIAQFGQVRVLPKKATQTIKFRRYNKVDSTPVQLQEGVTPTGKTLTKTDVSATVKQYGDWIGITDVIQDTHEDPVLQEVTDQLGEQAPEMFDKIYAGVIKAGTNVLYTNGTARAAVNNVVSRDLFRTAERILNRQLAKKLKKVINAGPNVGTSPIAAAFIVLCHTDLKPDLERLAGWKDVSEYASTNGLIEGELGSIPGFRFVADNNMSPWADAGGTAATNGTLSTTGANSDVYPMIVVGEDAYGIVPLGGKESVSIYVNNPKPITGDELAQRGSVGWKGWTTACILSDLSMLRVETAAKG